MNYKSNKILDWDKPTREAKVPYLFFPYILIYMYKLPTTKIIIPNKTLKPLFDIISKIFFSIFMCVFKP